MQLTLEVSFSFLLAAGVLWAMWRLPWKEGAYYGWGPSLAIWSERVMSSSQVVGTV